MKKAAKMPGFRSCNCAHPSVDNPATGGLHLGITPFLYRVRNWGGQRPFQEAILFPMTVSIDRSRPEENTPVRRAITKNSGNRYTISLCGGANRHSGCRRFYFQSLKISSNA